MLADNEKQRTDTNLVDFDAVSLYPSAMVRLYTLEGIPKVLQKDQLDVNYLLSRLFREGQVEPDRERFISGFFVHIEITRVGKPRHFPLIVFNKEFQNTDIESERSANVCCDMYVDHIMRYVCGSYYAGGLNYVSGL